MGASAGTRPWYLNVEDAPWEAYNGATHVTVDLETTNLDKGDPRNPDNRLVTAAVQVNGGEIHVGLDALRVLNDLTGPVVLVAHNAKFEIAWLEREGFDTSQFLPFDTMLAEYVLAGNRKWKLGLNALAKKYGLPVKGRLIDALMSGGICPSILPDHLLRERVRGDVATTTALFYLLRTLIEEEGLERVLFTRCITTPVLAHIEAAGLTLDAQRVASEYEAKLRERAAVEAKLAELSGGINMRSRPQLAEFIYGKLGFKEDTDRQGNPIRTSAGNPKTDKDTLDSLKASTTDQREFVKLRAEFGKLDAALSKNLEFFYGICEERGGLFYGTFNQAVTQTHRLSSSGKPVKFSLWKKAKSVQLQNMPRVMKPLFKARAEDRVLFESDGAQLEFRVAGADAEDPQVLHDVTHGEDIHRFTASVLNRVAEDAVTPKQRTAAKKHTFKPLYGGQSGTKREIEYYEAFRAKYSKVYKMQMGWVHSVLKHGWLRIASGLKFYWPDTRMTNDGYITNTPSIFNYPIQSFATADIIPVSMVLLFWEIRAQGIDALLLNTVHDSVVADVAKKDLDRYEETVVRCFLDGTYRYLDKVYGVKMYVPLGVGCKAGSHWGEGEERVYSYPYGETSNAR